jgi:putative nucleotidyltransferase with HDIG domain
MTKILIVEDDSFFREAITQFLKKKNFEVFEAPDGKAARDKLAVETFDIVLTDIQMPHFNGIELLEWSKKHRPVPFIMMTGFSMLLETQSAFDLGAKEFISKPFKNAELLEAIERIMPTVSKTLDLKPAPAMEYCKVSIDEFVARPQVEFDVYIKLAEKKFIKLVHKGEQMSVERVNFYKEKGLKFLFIARDDFGKLVDFNLNVANLIKDRGDISQEKKMNFMKYTGEVILEKAFIDGIDKNSFKEAQEFLNLTISVISDSKETFDLMNLLNSHSDYIYAHSVGVAMYSAMIARKMGFGSNQVFFKLSMAAIFHDIGKKEIDRTVLEKPRHLLTSAERRLIESHVTRSQEILMAIQGIPEDIIQIVYEHHEDSIGQGYPMAKVKKQLHPLSRVLQTANLFMEQALKGPNHAGMPGAQAAQYIERVYNTRLDPECIKILKSLFPT